MVNDIEILKAQLYNKRKNEMLTLINLEVLNSLFNYYYRIRGSQRNIEDSQRNLSLFEMKLGYEQFISDKNEYHHNFSFRNMTPEINIIVQQKYDSLLEDFSLSHMGDLCTFIEKSYIFN